MSRSQRRAMIDREEPKLSLVRQCALLGISRSSLYYLPTEAGAEDLELMALIDQQYLKTPFYGSGRMTAWLRYHGHQVNRKRVRRLMQLIGLEAIYRRPNTSKPNPGHKVYPYLLRGLEINRVNQVWATDITYIPMARGFLYLVAIMDWHSRYVLAWRLSNLQSLNLGGNSLSGEIPAELGSLSNLNSLSLRDNELSGCVPSSLEDKLDLYNNSDLGGLPYC